MAAEVATSAPNTVSVIIPSYNCEAYIAQTIDSVLQQTHPNVELIVVDDGSTDHTVDIVRGFGDAARLVTQANQRVCRARNHGIELARGQFICLMDHDDYWYPDKLERQLRLFAARPEVGIVYSDFILWHRDEETGEFPDPHSFDRGESADQIDEAYSGWIYHHFLIDCWMLTSTAMFRAEVFQRCGGFDESLPYSEDWDLWLRISREYPFAKLRQPTTLYRQHVNQGNRILREIDYRTTLLSEAVDRWGYASPDGRSLSRQRFLANLAKYHREFGIGHLKNGNRPVAVRSLWKAWRCDPLRMKLLAMAAAAALGWNGESFRGVGR